MLVQVKTLLIKEFAGIWVPEAIDHNIIQLFDDDKMAQRSWR